MIKLSCPTLNEKEETALLRVLRSGQLAMGPEVSKFENELCNYARRSYATALSSGTIALKLALQSLELKEGARIALSPFNCNVMLHVLLDLKLTPVFIDIDESFNPDPEQLLLKKDEYDAILIAHVFGHMSNMNRIEKTIHDIPLIEDAAQSFGTSIHNQKAGAFGDLSILSFYATKMLTTGEGGAILTDNPELNEKIRFMQKQEPPSSNILRGISTPPAPVPNLHPLNYKMTDLQAAIGREQLKKLDSFCAKRREIAGKYDDVFAALDLKLPQKKWGAHVYARYTLTLPTKKKRDHLASELIKKNIEVGILWADPLYLHEKIRKSHRPLDFPNTEHARSHVLSIPIHPSLTDEETNTVISSILDVVRSWK